MYKHIYAYEQLINKSAAGNLINVISKVGIILQCKLNTSNKIVQAVYFTKSIQNVLVTTTSVK